MELVQVKKYRNEFEYITILGRKKRVREKRFSYTFEYFP